MSTRSEKTKESSKGILKPLAAAFFATEPEEDDKLLTPKPVVKKAPSKVSIKEPDPLLGELSTEEARALLKEQLVGRISNEIGTQKEAPKKKAPVKGAETKKATDTEVSEVSAKEIAKKVSKIENKIEQKETKKAADKTSEKEAAGKVAAKKPEEAVKKAASPVKEKASKVASKAEKKEAVQTSSVQEEIHMEYAGESYDMDELVKKAVQVWTSVYKRSRRELWSVELYVKPEEKKAYYVLNKRKSGSIDL